MASKTFVLLRKQTKKHFCATWSEKIPLVECFRKLSTDLNRQYLRPKLINLSPYIEIFFLQIMGIFTKKIYVIFYFSNFFSVNIYVWFSQIKFQIELHVTIYLFKPEKNLKRRLKRFNNYRTEKKKKRPRNGLMSKILLILRLSIFYIIRFSKNPSFGGILCPKFQKCWEFDFFLPFFSTSLWT